MTRTATTEAEPRRTAGRRGSIAAAITVAVAVILSLLSGCNPAPDGVPSPEEMAQLLADIHTGESVSETERRAYSDDSTRRLLKQSILYKHGLTTEEFDSALMWYGQHIDLYTQVYDRVIEILEDRIGKLEKEGGYEVAPDNSGLASAAFDGDSVDIWTQARSAIISDRSPATVIPFHLVTDPNWAPGDRYLLSATTHGLQGQMLISMAVEYYDGSVDYVSQRAIGDGQKSIRLPLDSAKTAHYVYGLISCRPRPDTRVFVDSISLFRIRLAPYNSSPGFNVKHLKRTKP